jgi:mycothiol synthase
MIIRQATPSDFLGIAEVINSLFPDAPTSAAEIAESDQQRDPKYQFKRWVAIEDGQIAGSGNYSQSIWFAHPQKFRIFLGVKPEYQRYGIGSMLYENIIQGLLPLDPIALRAMASDDHPESIRFLEKYGFREVIRDVRSRLNVQAFDLTRFEGSEDRFQGEGIVIKTLAELDNDPERDQKLYDLDWELSLSVPGDLAATIERRGLERYIEYAITGPDANPDGFFIAVKGNEFIGLSHTTFLDKGVSLYQGLTGVKPPYRHLGIGIALKLRGIAYAKSNGYSALEAENDAKNKPMLAMNEKLGFVRTRDVITFEKELQPL